MQAAQRSAFLWPDNVLAWRCWEGVQTQWRASGFGVTGLDYAGVRAYLEILGIKGRERMEVFVGIQACERATLDVHAERREQG